MKNTKFTLLVASLLFLAGCYVYQPPVAQAPPPVPAPPPASYQSFYDELAPYGSWISYPQYGYVWVPNAEPGFRPYVTDGYWAYSDAGWTWVSDFNWGWAPFHYGRWFEDPMYGWMWVPGNDWAPAWVTWGNYNGYYGWAPIAPGYGVGYNPPMAAWCFTQPQYLGNRGWGNNYYVASNDRIVMGGNTYIENVNRITVINNTNNYNGRSYNAGPQRTEIENITRTPVQTVNIKENNGPARSQVSNGSLTIYRPRISSSSATSAKPANVVPTQTLRQRPAPARQQENTPARQQENTPPRQQENAPAINRESSPATTPAAKPQFQQPENRFERGGETQQPAPVRNQPATPSPQQNTQAPQHNATPAVPTRANKATTPAQQKQAKNKQQTKKPAKPVQNQPASKVNNDRRE